jgi:hypothetical protein
MLWEVDLPAVDAGEFAEVLQVVVAAGADWFFIPNTVATGDLPLIVAQLQAVPSAQVVLGVAADDLVARTRRVEVERIDALRSLPCAAVMVQAGTPSEMKSGGPFHRVNTLRQQGRCQFVFAEAHDVADAEWMIAHTPAHAVTLPYGIADQTAGFRVLGVAAEEVGTGVIARRPTGAVWATPEVSLDQDVRFMLGDPRVTMVLESVPASREEAGQLLSAAARPIAGAEREAMWERFRAAVKEPPKPRGNHPPEYGA